MWQTSLIWYLVYTFILFSPERSNYCILRKCSQCQLSLASVMIHQWGWEGRKFLVGHTVRMPSALASSPAWGANSELYQHSNYQLAVPIFGPGHAYNNKVCWQDLLWPVLRPVCAKYFWFTKWMILVGQRNSLLHCPVSLTLRSQHGALNQSKPLKSIKASASPWVL